MQDFSNFAVALSVDGNIKLVGIMPLSNYHLLKGWASDYCLDDDDDPHLEIRVEDGTASHRIALNVRSKFHPHDLLYCVRSQLSHPVLDALKAASVGLTDLWNGEAGPSLDYLRSGLLSRDEMKLAPFRQDGPANDLRDLIEPLILEGLNQPDVTFHALGERWGPERRRVDRYFGFLPGSGIHEVHMNQGSSGGHASGNGAGQDGALFIHDGRTNAWTGIFLAFQSQSWSTSSSTGHPLAPPSEEELAMGDQSPVIIIAALVNPIGREIGRETVTLLNRSNRLISLNGWSLEDDAGRSAVLTERLHAGETLRVALAEGPDQPRLSNKGGTIKLISPDGRQQSRVAYRDVDGRPEGWTVVF